MIFNFFLERGLPPQFKEPNSTLIIHSSSPLLSLQTGKNVKLHNNLFTFPLKITLPLSSSFLHNLPITSEPTKCGGGVRIGGGVVAGEEDQRELEQEQEETEARQG